MNYTQYQWLVFYFIYCFIGWVWESSYVSIRHKRWVNRGFLFGPALPIYGFGAIVMLFATLSVRDNIFLTFLFGMLAATLLEYITGTLGESIFHVRYWDYSNQPFNLQGYICLSSSLCWGVFSVLLTRYVHLPIEKLVYMMNETFLKPLTLFLLFFHVVDIIMSAQSAFSLKKILSGLAEKNKTIASVEEALEKISLGVSEDSSKFKAQLQQLNEDIKNLKSAGESRIQENNQRRRKHIVLLKNKAQLILSKIEQQLNSEDLNKDRLADTKSSLEYIQEKLDAISTSIGLNADKKYAHSMSILRRNPTAHSKKYAEELKELHKMSSKK